MRILAPAFRRAGLASHRYLQSLKCPVRSAVGSRRHLVESVLDDPQVFRTNRELGHLRRLKGPLRVVWIGGNHLHSLGSVQGSPVAHRGHEGRNLQRSDQQLGLTDSKVHRITGRPTLTLGLELPFGVRHQPGVLLHLDTSPGAQAETPCIVGQHLVPHAIQHKPHLVEGDITRYRQGFVQGNVAVSIPGPTDLGPLGSQPSPGSPAQERAVRCQSPFFHAGSHAHDLEDAAGGIGSLGGAVHQRAALVRLQTLPLPGADASGKEVGIEIRIGCQGQHPTCLSLQHGNCPQLIAQYLLNLLLEFAVKGGVKAAALARGFFGQDSHQLALLTQNLQTAAPLASQIGLAPSLEAHPTHHLIPGVALGAPLVDLFAGYRTHHTHDVWRDNLLPIRTGPRLAHLYPGCATEYCVVGLGDLGRYLAQRNIPIILGTGVLFLEIGCRDAQDSIELGQQGPLVVDLARDDTHFYQFALHGKAQAVAIVDVAPRRGPGGHADKGFVAQLG